MNLPNKLTVFRVILIVPFVVLLLGGERMGLSLQMAETLALILFVVASLTDLLDGKIARKYNLVTNFGKFMDPLADKLLVCSALIALVQLERIPAWVVIVIISREFIISGFRLIAADNGVVIAASYWGKFKTTFQMLMICMMIVKDAFFLSRFGNRDWFAMGADVIMWIALALTVVSLADYLFKNKDVMRETK